jgi:hypothetical protein
VTDCGGTIVTWGDKNWSSLTDKNIANKSYKACYKEKGFSDDDWYWTSEKRDSSSAWVVYFKYGNDLWDLHSYTNYALCVR